MARNNDYSSVANWDPNAIKFFQKGFLEMEDHLTEGWSSTWCVAKLFFERMFPVFSPPSALFDGHMSGYLSRYQRDTRAQEGGLRGQNIWALQHAQVTDCAVYTQVI